jgi:hypothetical protein
MNPRYVETLQLKAYSPSTIKTYKNEFGQLLEILKNKPVDNLDAEKLRSYFLRYHALKNCHASLRKRNRHQIYTRIVGA